MPQFNYFLELHCPTILSVDDYSAVKIRCLKMTKKKTDMKYLIRFGAPKKVMSSLNWLTCCKYPIIEVEWNGVMTHGRADLERMRYKVINNKDCVNNKIIREPPNLGGGV